MGLYKEYIYIYRYIKYIHIHKYLSELQNAQTSKPQLVVPFESGPTKPSTSSFGCSRLSKIGMKSSFKVSGPAFQIEDSWFQPSEVAGLGFGAKAVWFRLEGSVLDD